MNAQDTIPATAYATPEKALECGYVLLDAQSKSAFLREYGHISPLGQDFEAACDLAEERFAFTSPVGYVIAFDPEVNEFVAFAAISDIRVITASEQGVFDSIVDEAISHGDDVRVADGVARISDGMQITIAHLVPKYEES